MISSLKPSTCAHIYLSPSLQYLLHVFTVSQWSLFLKLQPALIYIYLLRLFNTVSTSRIYSLAVISFLKTSSCFHIYLFSSLQSVLHVFTVSQWSLFLKLQPAKTSYISISVSAICTSRIYSLAVISFLKTSTCFHIYLSPSLQSVLNVFTVSQWSLFLKLQPAAHIYLSPPSLQSVLNVFTVSQWSLFLKLQPALIYIYLRLCNLYFTYLQSRSDLFS